MGADVAVLGGGMGGVVVARLLARRLGPGRVTLVERDLTYRFAPSFLWVMTGDRSPRQITSDLGRLRGRGIKVLRAEVLAIDAVGNNVKTTEGTLTFDRLVIALGAELDAKALPGFSEGALDVYTLEGASAAGRALRDFGGGRVAVLVSRLPYKCPAAPYEAALLVEAALRAKGVRSRSLVDVYTPELLPMPTAGRQTGEALKGLLERRDIRFHPSHVVEAIDPDRRQLIFEGGESADFDLLLGVPPHRAPAPVRSSGLSGESGFVQVDARTLRTSAQGVFAVGDVTQIPLSMGRFLPKAGVFAHAQAGVVAKLVASELAGSAPVASFDGKGSCFVEMGNGLAAFATGDFYAADGPAVSLRRPGRRWHIAKVAFEQYWMRRWL